MSRPLHPCERIVVTRCSVDGTSAALAWPAAQMTNRQRVIICNVHATQVLYVGTTNPATTADHRIAPAGGVLDIPLGNCGTTLYAIGSGAGTTYTITEIG